MATNINIRELSAMVRAKRAKRGLRMVAEEIGNISASTLSRVEQGKIPDLDTFIRLCRWLGVSPEQFTTDTESRTNAVFDNVPPEPDMRRDLITAHLRADRTLDPETAEALVTMIRLAYEAVERGELGRHQEV